MLSKYPDTLFKPSCLGLSFSLCLPIHNPYGVRQALQRIRLPVNAWLTDCRCGNYRFNITIDRNSLDGSEQSYSDEEEFSDEEASPVVSDEEELDEEPGNNWTLTFPDEEEVKPSDSASRPRTSRRNRNPIRGSRSVSSSRRPSRRRIVQGRNSYPHRPRHYSPESPESVDSSEEYEGPCVSTPEGRLRQQPIMPGQVPPYNNTYPHGVAPHGPFMHPSGPYPPSDQLVRLPNPNQLAHQAPYRQPHYPYGPHFQYAHGNPMRPFFAPEHEPGQQGNIGRRAHHRQSSSHVRSDGHSPSQQSYSRPLLHGPSSYGLPPLGTHDLVPYSPGNYSYFRDPYQMLPGMMPHYLGSYPHIPSPPLAGNIPSPAPAPAPAPVPSDTAKDESISRLERLILEERTEREAQQAEVRKAAAEKAAREERAAHEKKIADVAAALARADAEKKAAEQAAKAKQEAEEAAVAAAEEAEQKAAEAAAKAKKEAEEAAAAAADEAEKKAAEAAARAKKEGEEEAAAKSRLPEKKAPIKFKDAIGRKFSFPFDLCCTWQVRFSAPYSSQAVSKQQF